jgi:hypothetical protein
MVTPNKRCSETIGVRLTDDNGKEYFDKRSPSVRESLDQRTVHGWSASLSFWERTFEELKDKLPS